MKIEYYNLYTHFILITQNRMLLITGRHRKRLEKYNKLSPGRFAWQRPASAFSVSKTDADKVCGYIYDQPVHHKKNKVRFVVEALL
jgi:hypothetical protein